MWLLLPAVGIGVDVSSTNSGGRACAPLGVLSSDA